MTTLLEEVHMEGIRQNIVVLFKLYEWYKKRYKSRATFKDFTTILETVMMFRDDLESFLWETSQRLNNEGGD